jgi:hypothetical protein
MIKWEPLKERHIRGQCEFGTVWIRLNHEGKVDGVYTLFEEKEKWVPRTDEEEELAIAREIVEDRVQLMIWQKEIDEYEIRRRVRRRTGHDV